jgi:hypothetical protein
MFDGDFIAKTLLSHDDLTSSNGLGRFCDGIRPVESGSKLKLGLSNCHQGAPWTCSG